MTIHRETAALTFEKCRLHVYQTRSPLPSQRWAWRIVARNGETISHGEGYRDRTDAVATGLAHNGPNVQIVAVTVDKSRAEKKAEAKIR